MTRRKKPQAKPEELLEFYISTLRVDQLSAAELRQTFAAFQAEVKDVSKKMPLEEAIMQTLKNQTPYQQNRSGDTRKIVFFAVLAHTLKPLVPRRFQNEKQFRQELEQFKLFEGREDRELTQLYRFGNWMDLGLKLVSATSNKSFLSCLAGLLSDGTIPDRRFARGGGSNMHVLERDFLYHYLSKIPFEPRYRHAAKPTKRVRPQRELFKEACAILKTVLENGSVPLRQSSDSDAATSEAAAAAAISTEALDDGEDDADDADDTGDADDDDDDDDAGADEDEDDDDQFSTTISEKSSSTGPQQVFSVPTTSRELAVFEDQGRSKRQRRANLISTLPQPSRTLRAPEHRQSNSLMWELESTGFLSELDADYWGPPHLQMTPQLADSIQARLMQRASETSALLSRLTESAAADTHRKPAAIHQPQPQPKRQQPQQPQQPQPPAESKPVVDCIDLPDVTIDKDAFGAPPHIEFSNLEGFGKPEHFDVPYVDLPALALPAISTSVAGPSSAVTLQTHAPIPWDADCLDEQLSSFYAL